MLQLFGVLFIVENIFEKEGDAIGVVLILIGITVIFSPLIRSPDIARLMQDIAKIIRGIGSNKVALAYALPMQSIKSENWTLGETKIIELTLFIMLVELKSEEKGMAVVPEKSQELVEQMN